MRYAELEQGAAQRGLVCLGGFVDGPDTMVMLGPDEPGGFWERFRTSSEAMDSHADPMDRWSKRVIGELANVVGAAAHFPSDGPPYHPFYSWALRTGRIHASPIGLLVHDRAGLWVSFRGALRIPGSVDLPPAPPSPCDACADKPCLTACPVGALGAGGYDVAACKDFLREPTGATCMSQGCRARALCPVSATWGRIAEQSAFHMKAFVGT